MATATAIQYVYTLAEGGRDMKAILGSKGANLCEMARLGLPVPPAIIVTTEACRTHMEQGDAFLEELTGPVSEGLRWLEEAFGKRLGDPTDPLLVSVRSGAAISMPGMMDTILNLGLNDTTVVALARATNNPRFAWDCYRRLLQMFGEVVLGIEGKPFESPLFQAKRSQGVLTDQDLSAETLQALCATYQQVIASESDSPFPQDPRAQLDQAIRAVFRSWDAPRARSYRAHEGIADTLGTAVNIQAMVFGNKGDRSASGVAFSRDPATGEKVLYGEFLFNAQGEDVVAGIRTPLKVSRMQELLPEAYAALIAAAGRLEQHYRDVQDIEFTIEDGRFFLLQTRTGKRTAQAALQIAVDLVSEGLIDIPTALRRLNPAGLEALLHPALDPDAPFEVLATGLPASPGAAVGTIVLTSAEAALAVHRDPNAKVILVREETRPDDIDGMIAAQGILTSQGGMTSHAAVVARGMGRPCVAGCESVRIDEDSGELTIAGETFHAGDLLTLNGTTGEVIRGAVATKPVTLPPALEQVLVWADEVRTLKVRTNADNATDALKAVEFGCEGIGLCRTEHMFLGERAEVVADLILLLTTPGRLDEAQTTWKAELLATLKEDQRGDFVELFRVLDGRPCTIRLIDPPLHEFLPTEEKLARRLAGLDSFPQGPGGSSSRLEERRRLTQLLERRHEFSEENPMLGFRGVRLGIIYPEINRMQVEAIFEAALQVQAEGIAVAPEIMVPLVADVEELRRIRALIENVASEIFGRTGQSIAYLVGTMIEIPRAALTAGDIATQAEFFSFGTNDLTQTTFGISRDDAEAKFLRAYVQDKVLADNPFERIDEIGVGRLMRLAVTEGRAARPGLKVGICGEHGGEPRSIRFCHSLGLDYVSCSPFRVPIARLAAAQAALGD